MFSLQATNIGRRTVVVSAPTIRLPSKKFLNLVGAGGFAAFPKRLDDGEAGSIQIEAQEIAKALQKAGYSGMVTLWPACYDKSDTLHLGKKWRFDIANPSAREVGQWRYVVAKVTQTLKRK
jgi:hypothetical protein